MAIAIMGKSVATAAQLREWLYKNNPSAPDYTEIFIAEGEEEGVRGDLAFIQSCKETGFFKFGGSVKASQNNFAGLGSTGAGVAGASFATPQLGIRAQIQHLKAYGSTEALKNTCVDPRFKYVKRGKCPTFESLGGSWAVPGYTYQKYSSFAEAFAVGDTYGQHIEQYYAKVIKLKGVESTTKDDTTVTETTVTKTKYFRVQVGAFRKKAGAEERVQLLKNKGFKNACIMEGEGWFRVQVGSYKNKTNAISMQKKVEQESHFSTCIKEVYL